MTLITFYSDNHLKHLCNLEYFKIQPLYKKGRWDLIGFLYRLYKLLKALKPDILYSFMEGPNFISLLFKPIFRRTRFIWGIRTAAMDKNKIGAIHYLLRKLSPILSKFPDKIIFNSETGKKHFISEGYPSERSDVIVNGIDIEHFPAERNTTLRKELNLENKIIIGMITRIDPVKGIDVLLKSFSDILLIQPHIHLVIVGSGETTYQDNLLQLANELNIQKHIHWVKESDRVSDYYRLFDIFVSASTNEAFSNSIMEAMASATPCIVTDAGDSAQMVSQTQAPIIPIDNVVELKNALLQLIQSTQEERDTIGQSLRKKVEQHYTVEKLIENTEMMMLNLLSYRDQ